MFRPHGLLATLVAPTLQFPTRRTVTFTSEPVTRRYLRVPRIC